MWLSFLFLFAWRLNSAWFLCEAIVYTMRGAHCRCIKPGDTRAMYNETSAVRTAVAWGESKHWSNNHNTSVHFKERKHPWNTLYQYRLFFKQYKEEEDSFVALTKHCEVNKSCFRSATHATTRLNSKQLDSGHKGSASAETGTKTGRGIILSRRCPQVAVKQMK